MSEHKPRGPFYGITHREPWSPYAKCKYKPVRRQVRGLGQMPRAFQRAYIQAGKLHTFRMNIIERLFG
jgi:hypothetical protein